MEAALKRRPQIQLDWHLQVAQISHASSPTPKVVQTPRLLIRLTPVDRPKNPSSHTWQTEGVYTPQVFLKVAS
jgi:hypothetical protein